ncbi:NTP transferase domain-containing protein [Rhodovibrionaceae bacterium A322]
MIFGPTPLDKAEGAILAHSLRVADINFKKGRQLSRDDLDALKAAGLEEVIAARLEDSDLHEDPAAETLARTVSGPNCQLSAAFTGRCNLIAETRGLVLVDEARLQEINQVDESLTLATLQSYQPVEARQMLATVKVIPFAAPRTVVQACVDIANMATDPLIRVVPFQTRKAGLVQTRLPAMKESLLDKTTAALNGRLSALDCPPVQERRCAHNSQAVAQALHELKAEGCDLLMVSGASAIVDRRDIVPAGIVEAGGHLIHFGMPVDPGNLLLLAQMDDLPVLGLPGCARSPKLNGLDWVLQRLVAGLPVTPKDIMAMGHGGLLKETSQRPLPRSAAVERQDGGPRAPTVSAIVLAAGMSRRMGSANKLLQEVGGKAMVQQAVETALASQVQEVVVVTGHAHKDIERLLAPFAGKIRFTHNPDYEAGLSTSLHRGVAALSQESEGCLVMLGDMPWVSPRVLDSIIAAFNPVEGRSLCLPTWKGKRGNPLLFARQFYSEVQEINGDVGAKALLASYPEVLAEVPQQDDGVLQDIDTPDALKAANS